MVGIHRPPCVHRPVRVRLRTHPEQKPRRSVGPYPEMSLESRDFIPSFSAISPFVGSSRTRSHPYRPRAYVAPVTSDLSVLCSGSSGKLLASHLTKVNSSSAYLGAQDPPPRPGGQVRAQGMCFLADLVTPGFACNPCLGPGGPARDGHARETLPVSHFPPTSRLIFAWGAV